MAGCYQVVILKIDLHVPPEQFDYQAYRQVQQAISAQLANDPDVFLIKKDLEEIVLIVKGTTPERLQAHKRSLMETIHQTVQPLGCGLIVGSGACKQRITELSQSFVEGLINVQNASSNGSVKTGNQVSHANLLKINKSAVDNYLRCGVTEEFDDFFDTFVQPLSEAALKSYLVKNYIIMDIVLTTAKFASELGGNLEQLIPGLSTIETTLSEVTTIEQLREQVQQILIGALEFRDTQASSQYTSMLQQVYAYIEQHYTNSNLSLNDVANLASLSPCHFSTVFSQETGRTFKEYLTELRIQKAKELLRTTALKSFEISYQIGYNDPHYFSYVFRKQTGLSPKEFRAQAQAG